MEVFMSRSTLFGLVVSVSILASTLAPVARGQQIHELYYDGSKWSDQGLDSAEANIYSGLGAFFTTPNDQLHVYYCVGAPGGGLTDVHQLFYNGTNWSDQDLTTLAGAPQAAQSPIAGFSIGNYQYVYYNDPRGHVHQLLYNNFNWTDSDLTQITGALYSWSSALVAFSTNPAIHVYYMDGNLHINQLFTADGSHWQNQYLTETTGGASGSENSPLNGIAAFNVNNYQYLYFVAGTGHVHEFFYNNATWSDRDLTQLSKTPPVDPSILNNMAAVAVPGTKKLRVYLLNNANHIFQLASSNNVTWAGSDLTKKTKGPQPNNYTNLFASVDSTNKQVSVYYESGGYVNHMIQYSSGWTNENLTALTGGPLEWNLTSMAGFNLSHTRYLFYNAVE
jgi:hypothetical protein